MTGREGARLTPEVPAGGRRLSVPWARGGAAVVVALFAFGCGHGTALRPTPKGALRAEVEMGGPIAHVNSAITVPMPLSTTGVAWGAGDFWDLSAHVHLTSLAFDVAGLDVGSTALLASGGRWALAGTGRLYGFTELQRGQPRIYMEAQLAPSFQVVPGWVTLFASGTALVQWAGGPPIPALGAGAQLRLGRFALQGEWRWYGMATPTQFAVVDWWSVGGQGAWGVVVSASWRFGGAS